METVLEIAKSYIINILSKHVGEHNKLKRPDLLKLVNQSYGLHRKHITDPTMRILIQQLRITQEGFRIVSSKHSGGGYFFAEDKDEGEKMIEIDLSSAYTRIEERNIQRKLLTEWEQPSPQIEMEI